MITKKILDHFVIGQNVRMSLDGGIFLDLPINIVKELGLEPGDNIVISVRKAPKGPPEPRCLCDGIGKYCDHPHYNPTVGTCPIMWKKDCIACDFYADCPACSGGVSPPCHGGDTPGREYNDLRF